MNPSQTARAAALRIANGHALPGDRVIVDTYCACLPCCAHGGRLLPSLTRLHRVTP